LPEAENLDVRSEKAAAAGVGIRNVDKVKHLRTNADPELLQALLSGEIKIDRAWLWSKALPNKQSAELRRYRENRSTNKIKRLISRHRSKSLSVAVDPSDVVRRLATLDSNELAAVSVKVVKGSEKEIYLTEGLVQSLPPYQEHVPT
jgi:hypothetical protein